PAVVSKQRVGDFSERGASTQIITPHTEFGGMYLIEANRGCARRCRFCVVGYVSADARFPTKEHVLGRVREALAVHKRVGLVGPSVFDHPQVEEIIEEAVAMGAQVSISSLRLNSLSERLLAALKASGHRTITLAPEAGSDRLRDVIFKPAGEEEILEKVALVARAGFPNLKLYIMIGLPTETDADIEDLIRLAKRCKHTMLAERKEPGALGRVTLSVNPFIPKAQTPFQWDVFCDAKRLEAKLKMLRRALGKVPNLEVTYELPKWSYVQTILSVGDRRVGRLLERVVESGGHWGRALRAHPVNSDFYAYRERAYEERLPWDHIAGGLSKQKLAAQRKRAYDLASAATVA
ncbi:MAG: radical SAM protein, partial [bacterium]